MRRKKLLILLPILVLWLATSLRFYRLDAQSLWNDEGNSARLSERSVPLIIEGTASDIHPPLYYLLLHGWRQLVGDSEFGLRAISAFAGVGVVAVTYALARGWGQSKPFSSLAALLAALNPALVYYSQEARMYELLALWALLSTWLLLHLLPHLRRPPPLRRFLARHWLLAGAYVLVLAAGLYTHYFFPAVLLGQGPMVVWRLWGVRRLVSGLLRWTALVVAALVLYLPWIPIFLRQAGGRPGDDVAILPFLADAARWLVLGSTGPDVSVLVLGAVAVLALVAVVIRILAVAAPQPRRGGSARRLPVVASVFMLVIPVAFMLAAGTTRPAYFKFMIIAVPFLALLLAIGVAAAWTVITRPGAGRLALRLVAFVLVALVLLGTARSLTNLYFDPAFARDDYRGIARRIADAAHPDAGIILNAPNQWEVFTYYHRQGAPVYPIPRGNPQPERVAQELSEIAERHDRLYALYWGDAEQDPQRLVESWLDAHAFKATEEWVGDVRFVTYAVPPEPAVEMEQKAGVSFGEDIVLAGYTLGETRLAAGDIAPVTLFWQTTTALDTRYKVFLHLLDAQGQLVAQRDAEPAGGAMPTTTWQPGDTVVDNHGVFLPLETAPGRYDLFVGLYPLGDPAARLPLQAGGGASVYHLGTLSVVAPTMSEESDGNTG